MGRVGCGKHSTGGWDCGLWLESARGSWRVRVNLSSSCKNVIVSFIVG